MRVPTRGRLAILAACLALSGVVPAEAAPFYITSTSAGFITSTAGAVTFADFDLPVMVDSGYATITGGTLNLGSNPGAGGNWLTAGPGVVTIDFTGYEQYFGLYWGSNDSSFNRVDLFSGTTLLGSIDGIGGPNSFFNITAGNSEAFFNRIELVSPLSYFEVDNLAVGEAPATVPEPTSLLMLGTGLVAIAAWRRRATRAQHVRQGTQLR